MPPISREEIKRRYLAYRERAKALYERCAVQHEPYQLCEEIKIPTHATVQMVEDGAFVEAVVWVPLRQLDWKKE